MQWNENQILLGARRVILFNDMLLVAKPKKSLRSFHLFGSSKVNFAVKEQFALSSLFLGCSSPSDGTLSCIVACRKIIVFS